MTLAPHKDGYRRIWMFPRNIRRIYPWKVGRIVLLMTNMRTADWASDQQAQDRFCKALEEQGLKREGYQRDAQSGGPRTYLAQLKALGLVFKAQDNFLYPTLAGEDLVSGANGLEIMQTMLVRHQYPSIYSQGNNVRINPRIKIKPFMFVLQLLDKLGTLSVEELAIPVIYGHNHNCLQVCIDKIIEMRSGKSIEDVIDNKEEDLHLPRSQRNNLEQKLDNIHDIANTCKNYMDSCFLVNTNIGDESRQEIAMNENAHALFSAELRTLDVFLPVHSEEQFQRRYGTWKKFKDTRHLAIGPPEREAHKTAQSIILAEYLQLCGENLVTGVPADFVETLHKDWGFDQHLINETLTPYAEKALDIFSSSFLELSRGGQSASLDFEHALCSLLKEKLFFNVKHTGQLRRPSGEMGGYADLFVLSVDEKFCGLVDAKASPSYRLNHDDYNAMLHTYIPNYAEIANGGHELEFCLYVAYGFAGNIGATLKKMTSKSGVPISAITALDLLKLAQGCESFFHQKKVREIFRRSELLSLD